MKGRIDSGLSRKIRHSGAGINRGASPRVIRVFYHLLILLVSFSLLEVGELLTF